MLTPGSRAPQKCGPFMPAHSPQQSTGVDKTCSHKQPHQSCTSREPIASAAWCLSVELASRTAVHHYRLSMWYATCNEDFQIQSNIALNLPLACSTACLLRSSACLVLLQTWFPVLARPFACPAWSNTSHRMLLVCMHGSSAERHVCYYVCIAIVHKGATARFLRHPQESHSARHGFSSEYTSHDL